MRKKMFGLLSLASLLAILAANCGGGGDNGAQAVLKLSTTGAGTIGAIDVTVQLPAGVTCRNAAPSGVAATADPLIAVNLNVPGRVRIGMITAIGFGTGEFCTVNCAIVSGTTPSSADFLIVKFLAADSNGRKLDGLVFPAVSLEMH